MPYLILALGVALGLYALYRFFLSATVHQIKAFFLTAVIVVLSLALFVMAITGRLPAAQQPRARNIGLAVAMITRILLLLSITWVMGLTATLFTTFGNEISGRDLILILGGLFLLAKSTHEIHNKLEGVEGESNTKVTASFTGVLIQVLLVDIVFSLDSVITAVGMVKEISIMVVAILISVGFMLLFSGAISDFVQRHPTVKMLALAFLILIGVTLMAEGFEQHIPKGYVYFAMAFSVLVEMLNLRLRKVSATPVHLRQEYSETAQ